MNVQVGSQLRWQGRPVLCTSISKFEEVRLAPRGSEELRADLMKLGNVKYLEFEVGQFEAGDVIKVESQRIELVEVGKNLWHLYTHYRARKETADESNRVEGSTGEASHVEVESTQQRTEGGEGAGEQGAGQDSNPGDGA